MGQGLVNGFLQLGRAERFFDKDIVAQHLFHFLACACRIARHEDDGQIGILTLCFDRKLRSAQSRHHNVGQNDINAICFMGFGNDLQGFFGTTGHKGIKAGIFKDDLGGRAQGLLIINNQNPFAISRKIVDLLQGGCLDLSGFGARQIDREGRAFALDAFDIDKAVRFFDPAMNNRQS